MGDGLTRRELIITAAQAAAALALAGCGVKSAKTASNGRKPRASGAGKMTVATNRDRAEAVRAAVASLGGMKAFVKQGDFVVIKPNAAWGRIPDAAATTHPETLSVVIQLCKDAGATDILVVDHTIDRPSEMVLAQTGIKEAAEKLGARVIAAQIESMYMSINVPGGKVLTREQVIKDILKADVLINLPTAKVHGATKVTLGMKNLMGVIWNPQAWHTSESIHQCIADFAGAMRPDLTILDAHMLLTSNGPKGPGDTKVTNQVIAGTDPVAIDAYGATLFGLKPADVPHIKLAYEGGLGEIEFAKVKV